LFILLRLNLIFALYTVGLPSIIWMVKSRRLQWAGHVARMVRQGIHTEFWWGNIYENGHLEN